ncbi:MAG: hypothetical protein Kow0042_24430 [Calditrichia bacterium]
MFKYVYFFVILFFSMGVLAQQSLRDQLFSEVDPLLKKAKQEKADIYSPSMFKKAMEDYERSENDLKRGGNLEEIRRRIKSSEAYLKKALEFADLAKLSFGSAIVARADALEAQADKYAKKTWLEAEEEFRSAMEKMENNDLKSAKKTASEAETLYRNAELEAIKGNLLNPAKELLTQGKEMEANKYAPETFKKAQQYIQETEQMLQEDRYERDEARELARQAKYEAKHAIYLTQVIKQLRKKDNVLEELVLMGEKPIAEISNALEIKPEFDEGYNKPLTLIFAAIDSLQNSNQKYERLILSQNEKVASLSNQISQMESRLGKFTEEEEKLRHKIALKNQQEEKIRQIAQTITRSEGQVLQDGDNVVIRLYGLNFPTGQSIIKPEYFELLRKVQDGIRSFDNCEVIIEGHTDSRGSDQLNQRLSEERANAVLQYIVANMSFPREKIKAVGYGETKPVANNETEAGRAKNRRIDVIIIPEWAER